MIKNGQLLPTPFIDLSAKVNTYDDRGFWGLAFDPQFATNGYVYLSYTFENAGNPNDTGAAARRGSRASRPSPSNPDVALAGSETTILGSIGTPPCSALPAERRLHRGRQRHAHARLAALRRRRDAVRRRRRRRRRGVRRPGCAARAGPRQPERQDPAHQRPTASAPSDNPFYDGTNSWRSRVWLYGVRNPFGFSLQPGDRRALLRRRRLEHLGGGQPRHRRATNFGWPCYEGTGPQSTYQAAFAQCRALPPSAVDPAVLHLRPQHRLGRDRRPVLHRHAVSRSSTGATSSSPTTRATSSGGSCSTTSTSPSRRSCSRPTSKPRSSIAHGPGRDALLPVVHHRRDPADPLQRPGRRRPRRRRRYGYSPLTVSFSSAGSVNPGGGSLTYLWDFGDGTTSTAANPSHTYTSATVQTFAAQLTVTNGAGADLVRGRAGDGRQRAADADDHARRPTAPPCIPGQTITYRGSATDPEDGTLPGAALQWTVLLHHNTPRAHVRRRDRHVGQLRGREPRHDRHVLLRDHPHRDRQQRAEVDARASTCPSAATRRRRPRRRR